MQQLAQLLLGWKALQWLQDLSDSFDNSAQQGSTSIVVYPGTFLILLIKGGRDYHCSKYCHAHIDMHIYKGPYPGEIP